MRYNYKGSRHTRTHTHTPPDELNQSSGTAELRLKIQHAMLRSVSRRLCVSRLQVYVVWCPSHLQPGDPLSRMQSDFHGCLARAEVASQCQWGELLPSLHKCSFVGGVVL